MFTCPQKISLFMCSMYSNLMFWVNKFDTFKNKKIKVPVLFKEVKRLLFNARKTSFIFWYNFEITKRTLCEYEQTL